MSRSLTRKLKQRISQIKTGNPFDINIIRTKIVVNVDKKETLLHELFYIKRVNGEWFDLGEEDLRLANERIDSMPDGKISRRVKEAFDFPTRSKAAFYHFHPIYKTNIDDFDFDI